ncbi:thiamine phosphate synthase [Spiribacter vilamensis]|uniref:Thiamine-phosphate synthase n=1 Tax=Spiribacter vilamensis TaxID=531306 RepID=A0A4Q8D2R5_9GAMM|nr:thiamine phosphate synthase [Spiribacter vilamensis]RZU99689.1 thiamine-phosphate diphosphorylase [Spiribacter vilamensis]TVO61361.1 thiamine phosphate synthase [Spiribacter vilamensis]
MTHSIAGLYVITDARQPRPVPLETAVAATLRGGARVIQYRDKSDDAARRQREAAGVAAQCREVDACFIVNDDVELARAVDADGVHMGRDDGDVAAVRAALGPDRWVGVSCYGDLDRARAAIDAGADYLAFGSMYPSPTKPEAAVVPLSIFAAARALTDRPLVAIGGINADNIAEVTAAGADAVAVVNAVSGAADIEAATADLIARGFGEQS